MISHKFKLISCLAVLSSNAIAGQITLGESFSFDSINSVNESCIITERLDEDSYSKSDLKKEKEFCEIDLYQDANIGVCPKTWSTSPGTIVYKLKGTSFENNKEGFEQKICGSGKTREFKSIAKFKNSMNQEGTSGTYSASNLAYYHLSRFLDTSVSVPVAVYREIDKSAHLQRAKLGLTSSPAGMIKNGWKWTIEAIVNPSKYNPISDIMTDDKEKVYGVLLKDSGERYGAEINGIRSEWGLQSSVDFGQTPAFKALSLNKSLNTAIKETLDNYPTYIKSEIKKHSGGLFKKKNAQALSNLSHLQSALPLISKEQMVYWMKELSEIVILDTIFGQQDRIGNIDYKWYAYSLDEKGSIVEEKLDSDVSILKINSLKASAEHSSKPIMLQRTMMGDNDAGVRVNYVNFSKNAKLVESISHLSAKTYEQLKVLVGDLNSKGELYSKFSDSYGLKDREVDQIVSNANYVFGALKSKCSSGQLKFDLSPKEFIKTKTVVEKNVACE